MSAFFHGTEDPWFKIGRLQVTTTVLVVLIGAVGMLATLFVSGLYETLALIPAQMFSGEVWRLVTWPLVDGFSLWTIINLALLWLFGRDLESQIGKRQMALLFVAIWASLTFTTTVVGLFVGGGIAGMRMIEFCLLLLWIAEWPTRRFFFNIPAWVIGIVFPLPPIFWQGRFRPWGFIVLVAHELRDLVVSSIRLVGLAFHRKVELNAGIVRVDLHSDDDLYQVAVAELISLVPGTVVVEVVRHPRRLYLHCIDLVGENPVQRIHTMVDGVEQRVLHAFGSTEEIAAFEESLNHSPEVSEPELEVDS